MTRRMTTAEACEFVESYDITPDIVATGLVNAIIADLDAQTARSDIESFISGISEDIDPDSYEIVPDHIDGADLDCVSITIRTEPPHV